jgi:hypothetical protein
VGNAVLYEAVTFLHLLPLSSILIISSFGGIVEVQVFSPSIITLLTYLCLS